MIIQIVFIENDDEIQTKPIFMLIFLLESSGHYSLLHLA